MPFFKYGIEETTYLAKKDKRLGEVIEKIGLIQREVIPDMFQALVNSIIGQQISTKAQKTIWKRFTDALGAVSYTHLDVYKRQVMVLRHVRKGTSSSPFSSNGI